MLDRYRLEDFGPVDLPIEVPASSYVPDGKLMACAAHVAQFGAPVGHRDAAAYALAQQCARVGIPRGEAESIVAGMIDASGGADRPSAKAKVRSAYRASRHPLGCELWKKLGAPCPSDCPLQAARVETVDIVPPKTRRDGKQTNPFPEVESVPPRRKSGKQDPAIDMALAEAWAAKVAGEYLYVEGDQWWRYDGGCWRYSSLERATRSVQEFLQEAWREGALKAVTPTRVRGVLFLAKSLLGPIPLDEFDRRSELIGFSNGVYDVESETLLPHSPEYRLTFQVGYPYEPDAKCPLWQRLVSEWLIDEDGSLCEAWVELLQDWFGYCIVPDTSAQAAMIWVGEGGNGKGVATRILERMVGREYCTAVPIEQLHDPYHRADLYGKRIGFVNEIDPLAWRRNGAQFKSIIGQDSISARRPTEKVFHFQPVIRMIISCNDLPKTRDVSLGFFRRLILIEWRYNVPEAVRDERLDEKLRLELPGILNWALVGLARLRGRGMQFQIPAESRKLLDGYRSGEDTIGTWIEEETEVDPDAVSVAATVYAQYAAWCKDNGLQPETANQLGRRLRKRGCTRLRPHLDGARSRCWSGIRLANRAGLVLPDGGWT